MKSIQAILESDRAQVVSKKLTEGINIRLANIALSLVLACFADLLTYNFMVVVVTVSVSNLFLQGFLYDFLVRRLSDDQAHYYAFASVVMLILVLMVDAKVSISRENQKAFEDGFVLTSRVYDALDHISALSTDDEVRTAFLSQGIGKKDVDKIAPAINRAIASHVRMSNLKLAIIVCEYYDAKGIAKCADRATHRASEVHY